MTTKTMACVLATAGALLGWAPANAEQSGMQDWGIKQAPTGETKSLAAGGALVFGNQFSYTINPNTGNAVLSFTELNNVSTRNSGSIEVRLIATATQIRSDGSGFSYYNLATLPLQPLAANTRYASVNQTVPYTRPADGTYYVYIAVYEYEPATCGNSDGFCVDDMIMATRRVRFDSSGLSDAGPAGTATASLSAAVLPASRAVTVDGTAVAFATVINGGSTRAERCVIALPPSVPATFTYQTTDPATNAVTGTPDTPITMPPNTYQTFVFAVRPTQAFSQDIALQFECNTGEFAPSVVGVNTFLLTASSTPTPDVIALAATPSNDGIVRVPRGGAAAFSVAAINVGITGPVVVSAVGSGGAATGATLTVCSTNAQGQCAQPPTASLINNSFGANQATTFSVFVSSNGQSVPLDPAGTRVFLRFTAPTSGTSLGATSVALQTQ